MKFRFLYAFIFSLFIFFVTGLQQVHAQQVPNIDQLSDEQLIQYLGIANGSGLSEAELEAKARQKGLSDDQIAKLKQRMQKLNSSSSAATSKSGSSDTTDYRKGVQVKKPTAQDYYSSNELKVFGSDLFSKENLTFEPNLQIATPKNYLIGTGDQINIDLFGYSDANFKLKVSPEGTIRIPNSGPVKIAGLSFEDAQQKIKSQLSKIYPQITGGKTSVQVSLGQIRSIRVTLVGEIQQPGTYTLPSLATIANALYVSGGPNKIGSYRNIELVRGGKVISQFDLYTFLMKGDLTKNLRLEDEDIIRVSPYELKVILNGAVKRKAIYEARKGETLQQLVNIGGGISELGYKEFVRIVRIGANQKEAVTVSSAQFSTFQLQSGDSCYVDSVSSRFKNRVIISGAVFHPGTYSTDNFPTLKDILVAASPTEEAYLNRGIITRRGENYIPKMVDFSVDDILKNKTNLNLQTEDSIKIFSVFDLKQRDTVSVNGEVNKAGSFRFAEGMQLQDAIMLAGGFKEGASGKKIEISRRLRDSTGAETEKIEYAVVKTIELKKDLSFQKDVSEFLLKPFDIIAVRKNPSYMEQSEFKISGQVMYPGNYVVQKKSERLSDIVLRAGGLKSDAYPKGAVLIRTNRQVTESKVQDIQRLTLMGSSDSIKTLNKDSLMDKVNTYTSSVGIQLENALANPGGKEDIFVESGDELLIPKEVQTVKTWGAVYLPKQVLFDGKSFKYYINQSGGFSPYALRSRSFVVYANGSVARTHKLLFIKSYPKVEKGAEVFVPLKKAKRTSTLAEVAGVAAIVTSLASVLMTFIYLTK